jgi:hypothetical protein
MKITSYARKLTPPFLAEPVGFAFLLANPTGMTKNESTLLAAAARYALFRHWDLQNWSLLH